MKKYLIILILLLILPFTVLADSYLTDSVAGSTTNCLKKVLNIGDEVTIINFNSVDEYTIKSDYVDLSRELDNSVRAKIESNELNIEFKGKLVLPTNLSWMFSNFKKVTKINGLTNFDTSNVTNFFATFAYCTALKELDLSGFNVENVTATTFMFANCLVLNNLNLDNWNTKSLVDMMGMFDNCQQIISLDLRHFDTSKVENLNQTFFAMTHLTSIDISTWDVSNVTDMSSLFCICYKLEYVDLSRWVTSSLTSMDYMFTNGGNTTMMALKKVDFGPGWDTSKVTKMLQIFYNCSELTSIDLSYFDTSNVNGFEALFYNCSKLKTIYVSDKWDISKGTNFTNMFYNCTSLIGESGQEFDSSKVDGTYARIDKEGEPGYLSYKTIKNFFNEFTNSSNDTSKSIVNDATSITFTRNSIEDQYFVCNVDVINSGSIKLYKKGTDIFIWSNNIIHFPKNATSMFKGLSNVKEINGLEYLDTSKVINMANMFYDCSSLIEIDLSNFDTSNVTDMSFMFYNCSSLTSLDLLSFDTTNVTSMRGMFEYLTVEHLDLSNFNTEKVLDFYGFVSRNSKLITIDISNFTAINSTDVTGMFGACFLLKRIFVGEKFEVNSSAISKNMFYQCNSLTNFTSSLTDKTNAFVGEGGYLTLAPTVTINDNSNLFGKILKITKNMFSNVKELFSSNNDWDHNDSDIINTGDTASIMSDDNIFRTYTISYLGDTNGDGKINYIDYVRVYNHINNKRLLNKEYLISADYNNDNVVDNNDYSKIYSDMKR